MRVRAIQSRKYKGIWRIPGTRTEIFECLPEERDRFGHSVEEIHLPEASADPEIDLPEDFPFRQFFISAGVWTLEGVRSIGDLTSIRGIGPKSALIIQQHIEDSR